MLVGSHDIHAQKEPRVSIFDINIQSDLLRVEGYIYSPKHLNIIYRLLNPKCITQEVCL